MARESVPRFDLYGELEVSRSASVDVIEAAYRSLAKRHHPDVASPDDADRIKRLNVAREWLTDPDRRRRYDTAMGFGRGERQVGGSSSGGRSSSRTRSSSGGTSSSGGASSSGGRVARDRRPTRSRQAAAGGTPKPGDDPASFGINGGEVRQYLADLRALDEARAEQVRAGRAAVDEIAYSAARRGALEAGSERRREEARLAREAATVIVRGELRDPELADVIAAIVADVAGAIALRDLLPRTEFELLLAPWTWRAGRISMRPTPAIAPAAEPPQAPAKRPAPATRGAPIASSATSSARVATRGRRGRWTLPPLTPALAAGVAVIAVAALAGAIALINRAPTAIADGASASPGPTVIVGGATGTPTHGATPAASPSPSPTPPGGIDPAVLLELQHGAAQTIGALVDAAALGDLAGARALLGGTAPGLRASGLAEAEFPDVNASEIAVVADGDGWLATAAGDTLRSADGETWTFDYGDRPLAVYDGTPDHDLFWLDPRHDLFLRVDFVTVTRTEVAVKFGWSYGAGGADAAFFDGATVWLSSLTIGNRSFEPGPTDAFALGAPDGEATLTIPGSFRGAANLGFLAAVTLSDAAGGSTNASAYELTTR